LDEKSNVQILHIAGSDKPVKFYNLDVIISIGYRLKRGLTPFIYTVYTVHGLKRGLTPFSLKRERKTPAGGGRGRGRVRKGV